MKNRVRSVSRLFQSRLSHRIVLWVFGSIVVIEGIILIPSVYRRERELLTYVTKLATAQATGLLQARDWPVEDPAIVVNHLAQVQRGSQVVGGTLYDRQGRPVGTFGEPPELTYAAIQQGQRHQLQRSRRRYDAVWDLPPLNDRYMLVVRHDVTAVRQELIAFIGRIAGLVLIISGFVTVATLIVLEPLLITPVLLLRRDLLRAGTSTQLDQLDQQPPQFDCLQFQRQDELGDVIAAFDQMFNQVRQAIAARKHMESELRLSETKFARAFRSSPTPMAISTLDRGLFIEVNDSFLQTFGYESGAVMCQTALDLGLWWDPHQRAQMIGQIRQTGMVRNQEYRFCTVTGAVRTMLYSAERIDINDQDCMLSVFSDISDRKQAEEALQASEARFRTLVAQAADAFYLTNADGKILDVNQQACDQLGYTRAEVLNLTVPDIQQRLDFSQYQDLWQRLDQSSEITVEGIHRRKDGSTFPVEVRVGKVNVCGSQLLLALARDTTERQQAQQAMQRLAELGEFAAMIVHEVRNPLTTIVLGLTALQASGLGDRDQQRLQFALTESERLQRLLNEILLYARGQRLDRERLDLNRLLTDIVEALHDHPTAQHCQITWVQPPESGLEPAAALTIEGDRDKLRQTFINLLTNACEAAPSGAIVSCKTHQDHHSRVQIVVFNPGPPIPAEVLPRLTQPFFTTKSHGNGLGLAITQQIVAAHAGELHIESSPALGGTQVTVTLPLVRDASR